MIFKKFFVHILLLSLLPLGSCVQFPEMDEPIVYEYVPLSFKKGDNFVIKKEDNSFGIQGAGFYSKDIGDSEFFSFVYENNEIHASGMVKCEVDETREWGVQFGTNLCFSDGDDQPEDTKERKADDTDSDWYPFVNEYAYPLEWCPFNPELYKQIRGVEFDLSGTFGKLAVYFSQGPETNVDNHPRCYVYEPGYKNKEYPFCTYSKKEQVWHVKAFVDEIKSRDSQKAFPELFRGVIINIATSANEGERAFDIVVRNVRLILESDISTFKGRDNIPHIEEEYCDGLLPRCDDSEDGCPIEESDWAKIPSSSFKIMKKEVTVGQYIKFMEATGYKERKNDRYCNIYLYITGTEEDREFLKDLPVNCVEYCSAYNFCEWLGGTLPSNEEWEWAAKSGDEKGGPYPWSLEKDVSPDCSLAFMHKDGDENCKGTAPQKGCSLPDGNTRQQVCDMAGNLAEWTNSPLKKGMFNTPFMMIKGGSFNSGEETLKIESTSMEHKNKAYQYIRLGMRCIKTI